MHDGAIQEKLLSSLDEFHLKLSPLMDRGQKIVA